MEVSRNAAAVGVEVRGHRAAGRGPVRTTWSNTAAAMHTGASAYR